MASTPVDIFIHDTYYIVAHFHYVVAGIIFALFAAVYYWFPKMFGRMMNETLGKIHFVLTYIFFNGAFFPMHFLGVAGHMRRIYNPTQYEFLQPMQHWNVFITISASILGASQIFFLVNFFWSLFAGKKAERNPWQANTLEWVAASPPPHGNFEVQPVVYRGPYEYSSPEVKEDWLPQIETGRRRRGSGALKKVDVMTAMAEGSYKASPSSFIGFVWPHRVALVLACATFPLLFIGGLVTSKGAGLAVPDWPTTFGYNMFLYPWSKMVGNIFYEHSHRLVASFVGLLTIALAVTFWLREPRAWLRWLGLGALGLVIVQGVLGGLRVVLLESTWRSFMPLRPGVFRSDGQSGIFTSADWTANRDSRHRRRPSAPALRRHNRINLHSSHVWRRAPPHRRTNRRPSVLCRAGGVARHLHSRSGNEIHPDGQINSASVLSRGPLADTTPARDGSYLGKFTSMLRVSNGMLVLLTTTHLVIGALMLATSLLLTLRGYRFCATSRASIGQKVLTEQFSV